MALVDDSLHKITFGVCCSQISLDTDEIRKHAVHEVLPHNHNFLPEEFDSAWIAREVGSRHLGSETRGERER